jgi:acyl-coenzyme A synthetase/AMP-(fatty) acid ligase
LYRQILKYCNLGQSDISSLRHGLTAGEPMSVALLDAWRSTAGTELYEALGMSEISTYISSSPVDPIKPGSPGRPQQGRRVVILPVEAGTDPVPTGEEGLLAIDRSDPSLMLSYWNRPDEEEQIFRGEWFIGGDLASMDADGYVWFHGRNDDLMNAMGYRVSPLEVEGVLAQHPAVAEVAVTEVRVRDDVSVIAAFVVPRDASEPDAAALLAFAQDRLAAYKCPREVVFVESLPRTANGKVTRKQLASIIHRR